MAQVVNVRTARPDSYVYIGRAMPGRTGSEWANPYHIGKDGTRDQVIAKYRMWLWRKLQSDPGAVERLRALAGDNLGCWCAPQPCHGGVLLSAIEWAMAQPQS